MKLRIEISENGEDEVVIRCKGITDEVVHLQNAVSSVISSGSEISLYSGDTEYFVPVLDIIFFETENGRIAAHTADKMYYTDQKLYELTAGLPRCFVRASKSAVINTRRVSAIDKNLTGASTAHFSGSRKSTCISRMYYKAIIETINETRFSK